MSKHKHDADQVGHLPARPRNPVEDLICAVKTHIGENTSDEFRLICRRAGTDVSGMLRNFICQKVHGKTFDELLAEADLHAAKRTAAALTDEGPVMRRSVVSIAGSQQGASA